nr:uncharacterized protein LOC109174707 [Ipomoea batatas]
MTSRRINGFAATPNYDGEEDSVFTIKLHLGGDMIFKPRFSYKNGLVEYFDHFNCDEGSILDLRRMVKQLRFCDKKAQFWYQYGNPRRPKLMKLSSDADILGLITDIPVNKELDIYVEHFEDESRGSDSVGEQDDENQVDVDGPSIQRNNLRDTATSSKPKGGLEEQAEDFVEVECNLSEQILRNLFLLRNSKWAVQYHEAMRQKDVMFKNYGPAILPIRAQELWHKTGMPSPLPPKYKPQPGRPKKKRKIDPAVEKPDLKKATKKGEVKKCKLCGMRGHNRTTCKGKSQQVPQPPSQAVPEPDSHVPENNDLQNAFQDVVVETQVPEFVLNEMDSMSSQPAQPETNDIPTVAYFISDTIANEPTPARKFVTVAGIKYTCTATWFRGKGK